MNLANKCTDERWQRILEKMYNSDLHFIKNQIRCPIFHLEERTEHEKKTGDPKAEAGNEEAKLKGCKCYKKNDSKTFVEKCKKRSEKERFCRYDIRVDENISELVEQIKEATGMHYAEIFRPLTKMLDYVFEDLLNCRSEREVSVVLRKRYNLN